MKCWRHRKYQIKTTDVKPNLKSSESEKKRRITDIQELNAANGENQMQAFTSLSIERASFY